MSQRLVLSTVGISILLNGLEKTEQEWRERLNAAANQPELSPELEDKVNELSQRVLDRMQNSSVQENRKRCAELNGLYGLYGNNLAAASKDTHFLIATDTALGKASATILQEFLRANQIQQVQVYIPPNLSTESTAKFSGGMKALIRWCEDTLPGYQERKYEIVFNLTGGFKGMQGYLTTVGMLYANQLVYIFEGGEQLLSIPKLPLQIKLEEVRQHGVHLAMMAEGYLLPSQQAAGIPSSLLEEDGDYVTLSDWGLLVWNKAKEELLCEELLPFPFMEFSDRFKKDFKDAECKDKVQLQESLAKVAKILAESHGDPSGLKSDRGLQYDNYTHKKQGNLPIGHFRVSQATRVSCTFEGGRLHLRRFGREEEVNANP